jgi:hypothetical protein
VNVNGDGTYTTPTGYLPDFNLTDGEPLYNWRASYSGDADNSPAATGCNFGTQYSPY